MCRHGAAAATAAAAAPPVDDTTAAYGGAIPATTATATPAPAPEPDKPALLTPEEQEAAVAEAWARKHARAMELFAQGKSAEAVAASIKVPLREACRLLGEYRNHAAARKAA